MAECTPKNAKDDKPSLSKAASEAMRQSDKQDDKKKKTKDTAQEQFPTTLKGFKYDFNERGQLRHIETNQPFEFHVSEDMSYNQKRYEALGEVITDSIYDLLESKGNLKKHNVPEDAKEKDALSFIFMSDDALTNSDKLLVIIHGSGVVRAGQWTRKLIINEDLDHGTQLPYIQKGMEEGYGIIVLNTNLNKAVVNGKEKFVKHNGSPEEHGEYVWKKIIKKAKAKHIAIVAHSYGGVVTAHLTHTYKEDFEKRVFAIAFTDSVHSVAFQYGGGGAKVGKFFEKKAVNWVTSSDPIDTRMKFSKPGDAKRISAGHEKHEWTSWSSFTSVFKFLQDMYPANKTSPSKSDENKGADNGKKETRKSNTKTANPDTSGDAEGASGESDGNKRVKIDDGNVEENPGVVKNSKDENKQVENEEGESKQVENEDGENKQVENEDDENKQVKNEDDENKQVKNEDGENKQVKNEDNENQQVENEGSKNKQSEIEQGDKLNVNTEANRESETNRAEEPMDTDKTEL